MDLVDFSHGEEPRERWARGPLAPASAGDQGRPPVTRRLLPRVGLAFVLLLLGLLRYAGRSHHYALLTISATSAALLLVGAVRRTLRFLRFGRGGLRSHGVYRLTFADDVIANLAPIHVQGRCIV